MAKNINHLQHVKSNVVENGLPKLPQPSVIVEGEIAVNYAKDYETLSIKNSSGEVVTFSSDNYYSEKKLGSWFIGENSGKTVTDVMRDDERIIAAALNDLKEQKLDASAYTEPDLDGYATEEWVEDRLGSGFTGENSGITVTKALEDDERAIAAALTDLDERKLDASAYTETDLSNYYTKQEIDDDKLGSGFTGDNSGKTVTSVMEENEEAIAAALADLDDRISGNTTYITQVNAKADTIARSLSGYTPSGYSYSKGEVEVKLADKLDASAYTPTDLSGYYTKQEIDEDKLGSGFTGDNSGTTVTDAFNVVERVVAASLTDLDDRKLDASAYTETDLSDYYNKEAIDDKLGEWFSGSSSVTQVLREDELAISSALNDLNDRKLDASAYTQPDLSSYATKQWVKDDVLGSGFTGNNSGRTITEVIEDNELITSAALNDLNERLVDVEENQLTPSSFKTINNESIIGSGNIEIQGGGSDANALSGVSVNGTAASVSNKVANITSVPASIVATSSTRTFVTSNEKSTWNAVTAKTDTTAFTQHTGDTTAHVTSAEKSTWNGKQDALSCGELKGSMSRNDVSGSGNITVRNTSGEFPTVISEGTYKVVTYMSSTTQSYGLNVTFGGNAYSLTTSNGVIEDEREITITSNKTWSATISGSVASGTILIVKLYLISSNVSVLGLVAVSNDYDDLYNKPTIPTSLSDINSAHTHSEYALNTAFTAHTASTTAHVTSTEKSTWNGKQNHFINEDVLSGISSTDVTSWNNAATSAHSHSNKSVLDNLTQAVITNSHTHSNKTVLDGITATKTGQWDNAISGVSLNGTAASVTNHVAALTGVATTTDLNTHTGDTTVHVTAANKTQWNNAISGVSLNGTAATVTNHVAALTGVATTANVSTHSGTTIPSATSSQMHLPAVTAADNGKILMVVNGAWALVNPTTIYTGTGTPSNDQGNNGDIYLQTS